MAEFKLGRIKFVWKGDWTNGTVYYVDDVIRYGGRSYICTVGHTSDADFNVDLEYSPSKWNQMSDGQEWKGDWNTSTFYKLNDLVKYGGLLYICSDSHTSAASVALGLENDQSKWTLFAEGLDWKGAWSTATRYKVNDLVRYGGYTYVCNTAHTSASTASVGLEGNQSSWDDFNPGLQYKGAWATSTRYKLNDVVKQGAGLWICTTAHAAALTFSTDVNSGFWSQFVEGVEFEDNWNIGTTYQPGDIVRYGGNQYVAKTISTGSNPLTITADWDLFSEGIKFQSDWANNTSYKIGEVVSYGGYTYLATTDSPSNTYTVTAVTAANDQFTIASTTGIVVGMTVRFTGTTFGNVFTGARYYVKTVSAGNITVSTTPGGVTFNITANASGTMTAVVSAEPPNAAYWITLNSGIKWRGEWADDFEYLLGDAVRFGSNAYICVLAHRSEADDGSTVGATGGGQANSRPDRDSTGVYWNSLSLGSEVDILSVRGDLVYFGGAGPTRLPVGVEGQVLVSNGTDPEWRTLGKIDHVYYVAPNGTDAPYPAHGGTLDKPWKTIRYACEQVENGARNPNAQHLLELNRAFIQREVSAWIRYQIDNNLSPFSKVIATSITSSNTLNTATDHGLIAGRTLRAKTTLNGIISERDYYVISAGLTSTAFRVSLTLNGPAVGTLVDGTGLTIDFVFDYDEYKCERDVGYIVDRLIWDIGHGGNLKIRAAAQSLLGVLDEGPFSAAEEDVPYATLASEKEEGVAAYQYMTELVTAVLANTAPAVAYQSVLNDSTAIVAQHFVSDVAKAAETGTTETAVSLINIVVDALSTLSSSSIPERSVPNSTINVKSGRYREILPIIVPAETVILGDEVRSTNAGPAGIITSRDDVKYSVDALSRLETVVGQIIVGTNVTESSGNTAIQSAAWPYASSVEVSTVRQLVRVMEHRIDFSTGSALFFSSADPVGYNVGFLQGYGDARTLIRENKEFVKSELIAYIAENFPNVKYSKTKCKRDIGYIVDAMIYDLTYGGRSQILNAGLAYYDGPGSNLMIDSTEIAATVSAYGRLKTVLQQIVSNTTVTRSTGNTATQWTSVYLINGNLASTFVGNGIDIVTNIISGDSTTGLTPQINVTQIATNNTFTSASHGLVIGDAVVPKITANGLTAGVKYWVVGTLTGSTFQLSATYGGSTLATFVNGTGLDIDIEVIDYPVATNGVNTTTALITAAQTLDAAQETIVTNTTAFISTNYPTLVYNSTKCERDVRLILEAVMFDFMFNSNVQTTNAAYAYLRSSASDVFDLGQKAATRAAFAFVKTAAQANVGGNATAQARISVLMDALDDIVYSATNEGSVCQTSIRAADHARLQLERNRDYIVSEITAYIGATNRTTVTAATASTDIFTCTSTAWMQRNAAIRFTGTTFGGIVAGTTYYVQNVVSSTTFTISTTRNSNTAFDIMDDGTGSMTVALSYSTTSCERDVHAYIDALKFDLMYPGNYKSRMAARYYANAVMGSLEEDMYYVRNGTGIRNQTLADLSGDLLAPNEYGTSRVSAGAYVSLDPGWGPNDFRTWIISRSPYVQNVTTFGHAAIGQKIDGALHNGGNDSIVSNDFTQVISDGIGAWITNNGRAELVSVFSYYAHIGYLAENGGRIRATNGNNSYGDFGSVAEGFDATEVIGTGVVDNRNFVSTVGSVFTDAADDVLQFEFENAGSDYTDVTWTIAGAGANARVEQDEFRDGAVFEVRLLDSVDDSTTAPESDGNFGGFGYVSNANTAQGGTTTQITIAATDQEISSAYVGMRIYLTGGAGVGQFANIATYNAGTKVATVTRESTGAPGFDHIIAGTTIVAPDASTTYTIEPRITFTAPTYSSTARTLATSQTYTDVGYAPLYRTYLGVSGTTSGTGINATFDVVRRGTKYSTVALKTAGTGYARLDTITIAGTTLTGTNPTNSITITITAVNEITGAILTYEFVGTAQGGNYVAISSGSRTINTSVDGITWTERLNALPSTASWTAIASGEDRTIVNAGSFVVGTAYKIVTVGTTAFTAIGSSADVVGRIFIATAVGAGSGTAIPMAHSMVAISSGGTANAYSTDGGITWTSGAALPTTGTWSAIAYGNGLWVAVRSGSNSTAYSSNGGQTWLTGGNLPQSTTWSGIAYGGGNWIAVASGGAVAAVSTDNGATWTEKVLPASSNWTSVSWGNNRFVAVSNSSGTTAAYSLTGQIWTASVIPSAQYTDVRYGQGVFLAVSQSTQAASSEDGIVWTSRTTSTAANGFSACIFGNPNQSGRWVAIQRGTASTVASQILVGATARARAYVAQEKIFAIRMLEPGSGYTSAPTMTITDPNNIFEAPFLVRTGNGAIANPSFVNRGTGYVAAEAEILTGDGYGDFFQDGQFISVKRLTKFPVAGSNVVFAHLPDQTFKLVQVLTQLGTIPGDYRAFFQIAPDMKRFSPPNHLDGATTRIRYSQVRLTGHDFLDIGTGNFDETNYPNLPTQLPVQANETVDNNGGRVFFTSTDQDGNFRVGDLFTIEQSTGVATLNADAFNIAGLQELTLGNITLGGGSASITEFSTDPFFTSNSDNVVPTQRAIKAYIASQIGGGGASLNVNSVTAGSIYIAGNQITTVTASAIQMKATFEFRAGVTGIPLAMSMMLT